MKNETLHFDLFDGLRSMLAVMVAFSHSLSYFSWDCYPVLENIITHFSGGMAVSIFFVLSGFCTACHADLQFYAEIKSVMDLLGTQIRFAKRKFLKVYPVYLVIFAVSLMCDRIFSVDLSGGGIHKTAVIIIDGLLLQTYFPCEAVMLSYTSTAWFLSCMMAVYFFCPLLFWVLYRISAVTRMLLLSVIWGIVCVWVFLYYDSWMYSACIIRILESAVGMHFGLVRRNRDHGNYLEFLQGAAILFTAFVMWAAYGTKGIQSVCLIAMPAAVMVFFLSYQDSCFRKVLHHPVFVIFSKYSLGVFLLHYFIMEIVGSMKFSRSNGWLTPFLAAGCIAISFTGSVIIMNAVRRCRYALKS